MIPFYCIQSLATLLRFITEVCRCITAALPMPSDELASQKRWGQHRGRDPSLYAKGYQGTCTNISELSLRVTTVSSVTHITGGV